jgi:RNA polymerase sigma factor (sigma-70 family)
VARTGVDPIPGERLFREPRDRARSLGLTPQQEDLVQTGLESASKIADRPNINDESSFRRLAYPSARGAMQRAHGEMALGSTGLSEADRQLQRRIQQFDDDWASRFDGNKPSANVVRIRLKLNKTPDEIERLRAGIKQERVFAVNPDMPEAGIDIAVGQGLEPGETGLDAEKAQALMSTLTAKQRAIAESLYIERLSVSEAAKKHNTTYQNVQNTRTNLINKMRKGGVAAPPEGGTPPAISGGSDATKRVYRSGSPSEAYSDEQRAKYYTPSIRVAESYGEGKGARYYADIDPSTDVPSEGGLLSLPPGKQKVYPSRMAVKPWGTYANEGMPPISGSSATNLQAPINKGTNEMGTWMHDPVTGSTGLLKQGESPEEWQRRIHLEWTSKGATIPGTKPISGGSPAPFVNQTSPYALDRNSAYNALKNATEKMQGNLPLTEPTVPYAFPDERGFESVISDTAPGGHSAPAAGKGFPALLDLMKAMLHLSGRN